MIATADIIHNLTVGDTKAALWRVYGETLLPEPDLTPANFAAAHRMLHEDYCSERPGMWDNSVFPYQPHVMNTFQEAMETGKKGIVFMKGGQIGGTDCMINGLFWLKTYYPGPQLFLTSTDSVASEFGRERFEKIIADMRPLRKKYLAGNRTQILVKRFSDGKIQLAGGQSVFKLQSTPYKFVMLDELDSLVENLGGQGDPLKLAEVRTDSFSGQTLIIAYAHPSNKERGAGKLYYEQSDQRRGYVKHSCGGEFWLQKDHIKCVGEKPDPDAYCYVCPECGSVIDDAERVAMIRKVQYRSCLPPEVAAKKAWIGVHASQLYSPAKSLRSFAQRIIEAGDDENALLVLDNKVFGEPRESKKLKVDQSSLQKLIVVKRRPSDPEFYSRGQVPPAVRFLTAGQDSRTTQLHFAVWGWGLRRGIDGHADLCGWLIDWGEIERPYSLTFDAAEYRIFDDLIYRRLYVSNVSERTYQVRGCAHDIGYAPTQIPILRYCRQHIGRAFAAKGASVEPTSACKAPYARNGNPIKFKLGDVGHVEAEPLLLNTYMLKSDWYGQLDKTLTIRDGNFGERVISRLSLPEDVDSNWIKQSASEYLAKGKREGEMVWKHDGPNHYADCNTQALGLAMNFDPFQAGQTAEEYNSKRAKTRNRPQATGERPHDAAMG